MARGDEPEIGDAREGIGRGDDEEGGRRHRPKAFKYCGAMPRCETLGYHLGGLAGRPGPGKRGKGARCFELSNGPVCSLKSVVTKS